MRNLFIKNEFYIRGLQADAMKVIILLYIYDLWKTY
jgi:hypothetical protein